MSNAISNILLFLLACGTILAFGRIAVSQEPKDKEIRIVSTEIRTRIETYFTLKKNEDWQGLYEIDDWPIRNKEDYVKIHIDDKTNPYLRFRKVLEIHLDARMHYWASSKKWQINGCTRLIDKAGNDIFAEGSLYMTMDENRGWIIGDSSVSAYGDGFHKCEKSPLEYPVNVILAK